MKAGWS